MHDVVAEQLAIACQGLRRRMSEVEGELYQVKNELAEKDRQLSKHRDATETYNREAERFNMLVEYKNSIINKLELQLKKANRPRR